MSAIGADHLRNATRRSNAMPTSTTTSKRKASGLAASERRARPAKTQRCPAFSAQIERRASAKPSAKGKAAVITVPAHTTAKVRLDQRVAGPHSRQTTTAKAEALS